MAWSARQWAPGTARWWGLWAAGLALGGVLVVSTPVSAATAESDLVWILETETVPEDLYALGNEVRIEGRIEGDLVAAAAERLVVEGEVVGSVTALAPVVEISGKVGGSVVVAAAEIDITGRVGADVVVAGFDLQIVGQVGRDLLGAVWSADHRGEVGRDLRGLFRSLHLAGNIAADGEVRSDRLTAAPGLLVEGDFDYQAARLSGGEYLQAGVEGSLVNRKVLGSNIRIRAFRLMAYLLMALLVTAGGLVFIRWRSPWVEAATVRAVKTPGRSLGRGLAVFLLPLAGVAALGMVVLWLPLYIWGPLLVGAIPFLTIGSGLWLLALWISHVPVAVVAGRGLGKIMGREWDPAWSYMVGVVAYLLVLQIPRIGMPIVGLTVVFGAGSWLGRAIPTGG